jgi:hypothetical protein
VFEHALDNSASVRVRSKSVHLASEGIDDKLHVLRGNSFNSFLNDVVAILIPNTFEDVVLQLLDHASLLVSENVFQCLMSSQ